MRARLAHWFCRVALAGVFLYSGYIKLESPLQFAATLSTYQLFPLSLIMPLSSYLPWVEVGLGCLLLAGWKIRYFAATAGLLLLSFVAVLTITYLRGIEADCGCFGPGERISPLTISRDLLFVLLAFYLAFEARFLRAPGAVGSA